MWIRRDNSNPEPIVFGAAIQGTRDEQQDSFRLQWLEDERAWLLVVADGMGGHASGGLASKIAADVFVASFVALRGAGSKLSDALHGALNDANASIAKAQTADPDTAGMGTTIVGGHLSSRGISWISVGDSPMWLYRKGRISRLNEDHSLRRVAGAAASGTGNMLQSALTGQSIPLVDCQPEPKLLAGDDLILVGSDGMLTLSEGQIASTLEKAATPNPELLAWLLLHAVEDRRKPQQDNCALIVARSLPPRKSPWFPLPAVGRALTDFRSNFVGIAAIGGAAILVVGGLIWMLR